MGNNLMIKNPDHWPRFEDGDDISGHLHNPFFVRSAAGRFVDLAADIGIAHPQVARGIAVADVDGNGLLDFAVARQWDSADFYRNTSAAPGNSLGLRLLVPLADTAGAAPGAAVGRPAVGATAVLTRPDGRRVVAQVDGGNGHTGARAPDLHLGLGDVAAGTPLRVDLSWRDQTGTVRRETQWFSAGSAPSIDAAPRASRIHVVVLGAPRPEVRGE